MAENKRKSLIKFTFTTPSDSGYSDLGIVNDEDLALLQAGLTRTKTSVTAISPDYRNVEINYRVVTKIETAPDNWLYQVSNEGSITGTMSYATLDRIRNWYVIMNDVMVDHNGFISKA